MSHNYESLLMTIWLLLRLPWQCWPWQWYSRQQFHAVWLLLVSLKGTLMVSRPQSKFTYQSPFCKTCWHSSWRRDWWGIFSSILAGTLDRLGSDTGARFLRGKSKWARGFGVLKMKKVITRRFWYNGVVWSFSILGFWWWLTDAGHFKGSRLTVTLGTTRALFSRYAFFAWTVNRGQKVVFYKK